MKTIITTDSGMDPINQDFMISGILNRNDNTSFKDVVEIDSREVLAQQQQGYTFKTSAPYIVDYENTFKRALEEAEHVVHISMGNGISSTSLMNANFVANEINEEIGEERIKVIDSMNGATGGTLISMYANYLTKLGKSYHEIVEILSRFIKRVKTSFFVPNPIGFIKSGRDSSELCLKDKAKILGAQALKMGGIKFQVDFDDEGKLYTKEFSRGKSSVKAMEMIRKIVNDETIKNFETKIAVIGTVLEDKVNMAEIQSYLEGYFEKVIRQDINAVVAAYGSPDLVGLSLCRKKS